MANRGSKLMSVDNYVQVYDINFAGPLGFVRFNF
jgi:hypothetical protein